MGGKPKPLKEPKEPPKRSGKRKVIWQGGIGGKPDTRVVVIDTDSNNMPCVIILEVTGEDSLANTYWREASVFEDMSWLEKKLVLELADKLGTLPEWATQKGQEKREAANKDYQVKRAAWDTQFYKIERAKREVAQQEAADLAETDCTADL